VEERWDDKRRVYREGKKRDEGIGLWLLIDQLPNAKSISGTPS